MELHFHILAEETVRRAGLLAEHGLSVYLEFRGKRFLFDTGQMWALQWNAARLHLDLSSLDFIVLSHGHYDHTGGLEKVLQTCRRKCPIFAHPDIFQKKVHRKQAEERFIGMPLSQERYESLGADFHLGTKWREIESGLFLTGEIPRKTNFETVESEFAVQTEGKLVPDPIRDDQALVLETSKGPVVFLGCGHSGLVNTLQAVQHELGLDYFYAVIGGFHLVQASETRIRRTVSELKKISFRYISPMHCTGFRARTAIFRAFPKQFLDLHVGNECEF